MACEQDCRCNACVCDMFDCVKNQAPAPTGFGGVVATLGRKSNQPDGLAAARRQAIARGRGRAPDRSWASHGAARTLFSPTFPSRSFFWPSGRTEWFPDTPDPTTDSDWLYQGPFTILNAPGSTVRASTEDIEFWVDEFKGYLDELNPCDDWLDGVTLADPPNVNVAADSAVAPHLTGDARADRSPGTDRLRLASSMDGLTWRRLDLSVAARAAVPCAVVDQSTLYLFMVMANANKDSGDEVRNGLVVGTSDDLVNWRFEKVVVDFPEPWDAGDEGAYTWDTEHILDPSVVWVDDDGGFWRIYFTLIGTIEGSPVERFRSFSARSKSLAGPYNAETGYRYAGPDRDVETQVYDPSVMKMGDEWVFFGGTGQNGLNHYATSGDGLEFTRVDDGYLELFWDENDRYPTMMANGVEMDGLYRFYAFALDEGSLKKKSAHDVPSAFIVSFTWDAVNADWVQDDGIRLEVDPTDPAETWYVMDPVVVRFGDCWVMIYVTEAPDRT